MQTYEDVLERVHEVNEFFFSQDWSDGLPIIPPTPASVDRMLRGTQRDRYELIGTIAPGWGKATVERIAIHGVMAGCKPEYMPVLIGHPLTTMPRDEVARQAQRAWEQIERQR